jgi:protocatechuate 3,4-dioxygenase beta subunit
MLQKQTIIFIVFMLGVAVLPACGSQEVVTPPAPTQPPPEETPTAEPATVTLPPPTAEPTNEVPTPEAISSTATPEEIITDSSLTDTPPPEATATELPTATAEVIACDGTLTPAQTEGPYYTPNTPERASLIEPDMGGTPLLVTGRVLTQNCEPIAGAKLDFWQTDDQGQYDNAGYRLRGHQFTDENGNYALETILPGEYPGRTAHIHVKVFAPGGEEWLTSQIYLPGISDQTSDGIYREDLLAENLEPAENGQRRVEFNFILPN